MRDLVIGSDGVMERGSSSYLKHDLGGPVSQGHSQLDERKANEEEG